MRPAASKRRTIAMLASVGVAPLIWASAASTVTPSAAAPLAGSVARWEDPEPAFRWFDTLGFPDIRGAQFVRIATGRCIQEADQPPRRHYQHGFLLDDDGSDFRVFVLDTLETRWYRKTFFRVGEFERVYFDERNLAAYIDEKLGDDSVPGFVSYGRLLDGRVDGLSKRASNFALAWAGSRCGLCDAASRLFQIVARMPDDSASARHSTVRLKAAEDLANAEMWRAVELAGKAHVARDYLAERFRRIANFYPESSHGARAAQTAAMFEQMFREDQEHVAPEFGRAFEPPRLQERIAEGIYRLRDQNGRQSMLPGRCDVFHHPISLENTFAHELVRFGYDAVPQLIEALDDRRCTRTVECDDFDRFTHRILTVGECAEEVIVRIAGRRFEPPDSGSPRSAAEQLAEKKRLIQTWYADIRRLGERPVWTAGVERGDADSHTQADLLIAKYPADAAGSIVVGARRATDLEVRAGLIERLADLRGPEISSFLLEEARSSHARAAYLSAAMVLHHRGRPEGLAELQRRWRQAVENPVEPESPGRVDSQPNGHRRTASFLIWSNRTAAVRLVSETMHVFPIDVRPAVVKACDRDALKYERFPAPDAVTPDPDYDAEIVALLIRALDDEERAVLRNGYRHGKRYDVTRICDTAAQVLSKRDPQRYPFDAKPDMISRDRARYALIDAWRKENGLPPRLEKNPKWPTHVAAD